jgi:hypothetical protein
VTREMWMTEFVTVLCRELRSDIRRSDAREVAVSEWPALRSKNPRQAALDWSVRHTQASGGGLPSD